MAVTKNYTTPRSEAQVGDLVEIATWPRGRLAMRVDTVPKHKDRVCVVDLTDGEITEAWRTEVTLFTGEVTITNNL